MKFEISYAWSTAVVYMRLSNDNFTVTNGIANKSEPNDVKHRAAQKNPCHY